MNRNDNNFYPEIKDHFNGFDDEYEINGDKALLNVKN